MAEEDAADVKYEEEFIINRRGLKLFTCRWLPRNQEPKGLVFLCHGYAAECSISMRDTGSRLAQAGMAVYGADYEGHGKTSGLHGYVPSFDGVVGDCCDFFTSVAERKENQNKKKFLLGESMGGAVALLVHRRQPSFWDGAVLVAPMCKIADEMKPNPLVANALIMLTKFFPTWKVVPGKDVIDASFKESKRREEIRNNPYFYKGRPRLKTALELLIVSEKIEKSLHEVSLPFLIVQGEEDRVVDPKVCKLLFDSASSLDKTLNLYPGMWHGLTSGEPPENIDLVFADIVSWLDQRIKQGTTECERKSGHDVRALSS
ncbi:caffeoylshikimate esterase-like [Nymphaea colorata]|nr:caffeoylshikimate esterase-like [Nymphaea colorata]